MTMNNEIEMMHNDAIEAASKMFKKNVDEETVAVLKNEEKGEKIIIDTSGMDELHQLMYQQYLDDFSEFYLVYQPMVSSDENDENHKLYQGQTGEVLYISKVEQVVD